MDKRQRSGTQTLVAASTLLVGSMQALAHPGHDHAHWASPALHVLFFGALIAAAGIGGWLLLRARRRAGAVRNKH